MHKYHKSCSQTDLTVLRLISTVWAKKSQNSYLREFCAQLSKIVFLADLTVLRHYYNCMSKNFTKLISPRVLCTNVTNRVLSWFDRFTAYYYCISRNVKKNSYLLEFRAQVSKIIFLANLTILQLVTTVRTKISQNWYLRNFYAQV